MITLLLLALILLSACTAENNIIIPQLSVTLTDGGNLDGHAINIAEDGGELIVNVVSNSSWIAKSNADWLTLSKQNGEGNGYISITASAAEQSRSAAVEVYLSNYNQIRSSFDIIQHVTPKEEQPEDNEAEEDEENPEDNTGNGENEDKPEEDNNDGEEGNDDENQDNPEDSSGDEEQNPEDEENKEENTGENPEDNTENGENEDKPEEDNNDNEEGNDDENQENPENSSGDEEQNPEDEENKEDTPAEEDKENTDDTDNKEDNKDENTEENPDDNKDNEGNGDDVEGDENEDPDVDDKEEVEDPDIEDNENTDDPNVDDKEDEDDPDIEDNENPDIGDNDEENLPDNKDDNEEEGDDDINNNEDGNDDNEDNDENYGEGEDNNDNNDNNDPTPEQPQGAYLMINKLSQLSAGEYYIGGYQGEALHLATTGITGGHCNTTQYTFTDTGDLTPASETEAVIVTLEKAAKNGYYIRFKEGYLTASAAGPGKLVISEEKSEHWIFSAHPDGGFMLHQSGDIDVQLIISPKAKNGSLIRSIAGDEEGNAIILFRKNE